MSPLRGDAVSTTALGKAPSRSPARWAWFGAGAGLAAAAALLLTLILPGVDLWSSSSITLRPTAAPAQVRGAHHRAASDATTLIRPTGGDELVVSLTVEAAPGARLRLQLVDAAGGGAGVSTDLVLSDPAGLIFFTVDGAALPATGGEFRVTNVETGEIFSYPFRLTDAGRP